MKPGAEHLPTSEACEGHCMGAFVDEETLAVTRCDSCKRFETDEDAAALCTALLEILYGVAREAGSPTVADALDEVARRCAVRS
jgi:hypothetical protein